MGDKKCVLVVDDDSAVRQLVTRVLENQYEVLAAKDAFEGFAIANSRRIDLLILDLGLPRIDGNALAAMFREHPSTRGIPILVLTGRCGKEDEELAYESGADLFLTKPFDFEELQTQVKTLIERAAVSNPGTC